MNPYDNNPFKTDDNEIKNERDANRELVNTLKDIARPGLDASDWFAYWENEK